MLALFLTIYLYIAPSVIWFHPYGIPSLPLLDQSIHTRPLLHTSKLTYHRCNIFTYLIIQYYYFYKLYYFIVLFIYLSIYCFRSILLYAPTRDGHTYDKC